MKINVYPFKSFWHSFDFPIDSVSALVEVLGWRRQTTIHYIVQCWPRSIYTNVRIYDDNNNMIYMCVYIHMVFVCMYAYLFVSIHCIYVVNFDALATGKRYSNRKETSCLPLLNAGFEPKVRHLFASRLNACWQTDWAIEDQAKNLELDSPSLWSASIQPTRPHCQLAFAPGSGDIHICCC